MDHNRQMAMCQFQTRVRGLRKHVCLELAAGDDTDIECHPNWRAIAKRKYFSYASENAMMRAALAVVGRDHARRFES